MEGGVISAKNLGWVICVHCQKKNIMSVPRIDQISLEEGILYHKNIKGIFRPQKIMLGM